MPLASGARLGPYEVVAPLGAGGMGEVYRARDTRLDRTVAIKILPEILAADPQFRERFEREARVVSSLNHPHICVLFDIGRQDGVDFLVMEYVDGETLAARLERGPLPLEQVLRHAIEIGDALDKAHRQGVIHRDLKPANVMLTKGGVKVLDFGLAKVAPAGAVMSGVSMQATVQKGITAQGTILGTLQYMAPEQLESGEADARSDLFAFGTLIYEMATGRKAFEGKSHASLIAAILEHQPPAIAMFQPVTPPALDHVVQRCLAKDPEQRWLTAHDVVLELKWIAERLGERETATTKAAPRTTRELVAWGLVAALVTALGVTLVLNARRATPMSSTNRLTMSLDGTESLAGAGLANTIAISPDGSLVAYATFTDNRSGPLRVRSLNAFQSVALAGTEGAAAPFFSPDGQWIGFISGPQLKKTAATGGVVLPVADLPGGIGQPIWTPDGLIVFPADAGIMAVAAAGGALRPLVPADPKQGSRLFGAATLLPDGHTLLFPERTVTATWDDARIVAHDLRTGIRKTVVPGGFGPRYVRTGHLVFTRAGSLLAVPFDASRVIAIGAPVPVLQGLITGSSPGTNFGIVQGAIADPGTLVYISGVGAIQDGQLLWVDRNGGARAALPMSRRFEHPRLSPDGRRVAVDIRESNVDVWVGDLTRNTLERQTFDPREDESPVWHPDGTRITFAATRDSGRQALIKAADGSGEEVRIFDHGLAHQHVGSWSPDGRMLAVTVYGPTGPDIFTIATGEKPSLKPFVQTTFTEQAPMFSPDGKWIAYMSDESGRTEIYVQPFPGPGGKRQVSTEGGFEPAWNRNGRELFYRVGNRMMAVPVTLTPTFSCDAPRVLFEGRFAKIGWGERDYDVAPDGSRFLMISAPEDRSRAELNVVLNWFEELRKKQ